MNQTIKLTLTTLTLITLTACDSNNGKGKQNSAHGLINVPPIAQSQTIKLNEDTQSSITLKATDEDNDTIGYRISLKPKHGTLKGKAPNITYIPNKDYNGADSFAFIANDGQADSKEAAVTLDIKPINDKPIAKEDQATTDEDTSITITPLGNDTDVDIATNQDKLTITNITKPQNGKAKIKDNTIIYTPNPNFNGSDSITYTIEDKAKASATAKVNIAINPVNDAPQAKDDNTSTEQAQAITIDVLKNDSDVDGGKLSIINVSKPKHGNATIKDNKIIYQSDENYLGQEILKYTLEDENKSKAQALITITVESNKKDMGVVELLDDDKLRDTRYGNLHVHGLIKNDNMKKLETLKLCSETKCWRVVDANHPLKQKNKKQISQNYSTFLIGKMVFKDINETIESIEYKYNGKQGVLKLKDKLYFAQAVIDVLYLKFGEGVEEYLATLVPPFDYELFIYHNSSKYIFSNDIVVEAEIDTINTSALIYTSFVNKNDISFSCRVSLINDFPNNAKDTKKIIDAVSRDTFKTKIPHRLNKKIKIYIPVNLSKISEDKLRQKYIMQINGNRHDYSIEYVNDKKYIYIETDYSNAYIDFREENQWGII